MVNLIRFIYFVSPCASAELHAVFDMLITKMTFTRAGVLMKGKQLGMIKRGGKQARSLLKEDHEEDSGFE